MHHAGAPVATGFGVLIPRGGFALDQEALLDVGVPPHEAALRVRASACWSTPTSRGPPSAPRCTSSSGAFRIARACSSRGSSAFPSARRSRSSSFATPTGFERGPGGGVVARFLDAVHRLGSLFAPPCRQSLGARLGTSVYWVGDIFVLWAASSVHAARHAVRRRVDSAMRRATRCRAGRFHLQARARSRRCFRSRSRGRSRAPAGAPRGFRVPPLQPLAAADPGDSRIAGVEASPRGYRLKTMTTLSEQLIKYLEDAHAIEVQALAQLRTAPSVAGDPELAAVYREHLAETEGHERAMRLALEAHDAKPARTKDIVMAVGGKGVVLFARLQPDTPKAPRAFAVVRGARALVVPAPAACRRARGRRRRRRERGAHRT